MTSTESTVTPFCFNAGVEIEVELHFIYVKSWRIAAHLFNALVRLNLK